MKKIFITGFLSIISCFKVYVPDEAKALVSESSFESIIPNKYDYDVDNQNRNTLAENQKQLCPVSMITPKSTYRSTYRDLYPDTYPETYQDVSWDSIRTIIKLSESLQLDAYICPAGYWTIGYGHLITCQDEHLMDGIVETQADSLLRSDLKYCEKFVKRHLKLQGNQLKAISLFCFAFGSAKLYRSELFKKIKAREPIDTEIMKWCKLNDKISKRLIEARQLELDLYNSAWAL